MDLLRFYARRVITALKNEVLVLPSRIVVALFCLTLLILPLVTDEVDDDGSVAPFGVTQVRSERLFFE